MSNRSIDAQSLVSGKPPDHSIRSFLVVGSEQFLMDKVHGFLRNAMKAQYKAEIVVLWGDELKVAELRDHLDSYSLFAETKVLFIKNSDQIKADVLIPLVEYYASPSEDLILVISATSVDRRLSAWKTITANSLTITCDPPRNQSDLGKWLDCELRHLKKTISPEARQEFLERVELDYKSADNELQKVLLLISDNRQIEIGDVLSSIGSSRASSLSDLYKALFSSNPGQVMATIQDALDTGGDAIPTLATINRFFMILWRIALLRKKHITPNEISRSHLKDVFDSQRNLYLQASEKFQLEKYADIFDTLLDTDSKLKLTAADQKTLMSMCINRIYYLI